MTGSVTKEHDNIKYYLGIRAQKMIGVFTGPKKELNNNRFEKYLAIFVKNFDTFKEKKLDKMTLKQVEQILFKPPAAALGCTFKNIYRIKEARLKGAAYRLATELFALPIINECPACRRPTRGKYHLFLECPVLAPMRAVLADWVHALNVGPRDVDMTFDDVTAIWHNNLNYKQQMVITIYNHEIWKEYCHWWFERKFDHQATALRADSQLRFYIQHGGLG